MLIFEGAIQIKLLLLCLTTNFEVSPLPLNTFVYVFAHNKINYTRNFTSSAFGPKSVFAERCDENDKRYKPSPAMI